ncbi:MAG: 2-C-methyl-D-erythritol 4-phosphate cytidylyltransferase, partial [Ruminococcaceae bacterium]|nr:2-C-methyl-D-erythritol 4-phosphate cytidylyltransferase [Oscillospiraceae bacterium]
MQRVSAVIVAGGSSSRMGTNKLFLNIGGKSVLERSVALMQNNALISEIVIATKEESLAQVKELSKNYNKVTAVVKGGDNRFASTMNAIAATDPDADYYAIHDAARPFASDALVTRVIEAAFKEGAAAPAVPVTDTIKTADNGVITNTPDRNRLFAVATPQVFRASLYKAAAKGNTEAFDDCQLIERHGERVVLVEGERDNIKITTKEDIARAKAIAGTNGMRIGHGYDVH